MSVPFWFPFQCSTVGMFRMNIFLKVKMVENELNES